MKVLCTMPGKFGDIMWSLPTVRAIAKAAGEPVDFMISAAYGTLAPLLAHQPYLRNWIVNAKWQVRDTAPMTPSRPPDCPVDPPIDYAWDKIIHLGYERWPQNLLPVEIYLQATGQWGSNLPGLELETPWITAPREMPHQDPVRYVAVGFTDEWIELKVGVFGAVCAQVSDLRFIWLSPKDRESRFHEWFVPQTTHWNAAFSGQRRANFSEAAEIIKSSQLFLGCLSAQWVLANALGIPTVIMEPSEPRHSPIFFYDHPRNTLVLGNDGKPTFDARAVVDAVKARLSCSG